MRFRKAKDGGISYHAKVGRGVDYQVQYHPKTGWKAQRREFYEVGVRFGGGHIHDSLADAKAWCVKDYLAFAVQRDAFDSIMEERRLVREDGDRAGVPGE
jgi:hypothetical protein